MRGYDSKATLRRMACVLALLAGSVGTALAQPATLRLGYGTAAEEPLWLVVAKPELAKNQGKAYTLDATRFTGSDKRGQAFEAGAIDLASSSANGVIFAAAEGVSAKIVASVSRESPRGFSTGFYVKDSSPIRSIADLKGKTVAASAPGTAPYFTLAWFLKKNGLSVKDVTVVNLEPAAAAQAFVAGQNDAAMTYEPYLSTVRDNPAAGKIIATTLDYPMIMDTFGCTPKFLADNPKAAQALANSYFEAVDMIRRDSFKSFEIMGAPTKQSGEQFAKSAAYLRWQDKAANQKFFAGEFQQFSKDAADLLLEAGIIKSIPDLTNLADTSYIK